MFTDLAAPGVESVAAEPPKFKVGDCVQGHVGHVGWIVEPSKRADRWLVEWVIGEKGPYSMPPRTVWGKGRLTHYLVPGDKVELLPCKRYGERHPDVGSVRTVESRKGGGFLRAGRDHVALLLLSRSEKGSNQWPLSRVKKL